MTLVAGRVSAVFAAVVLVSGIWLVSREGYFGFDQAWISIGSLGVIVGAVLGAALFAPQACPLIRETQVGAPAAAVRERRIGMVAALETVTLSVAVWAMVYRPGT